MGCLRQPRAGGGKNRLSLGRGAIIMPLTTHRTAWFEACVQRVETVQNPPFDWDVAREALKSRLGAEVVSRWLGPLAVSTITDEAIVLEAPNRFFRDWVESHYLEAIKPYAGERVVSVIAAAASSAPAPVVTKPVLRPAPINETTWDHGLNARYTFDRFVVGTSNRFAHAASQAVAESPAKAYNPLFIYGGVGLGKTHLMQAAGHAIRHRWPAKRVVYLSSERFTNELIAAIQTKTTTRFRERYRTVDVLLVDDIHFIAEKEATQEEFFHTFNTLYDAHKQIVMSSDRSPKDIAGLEERLVSRFEWGLVTDIQPPDLETRIAILRKKAEEAAIAVPDDVTGFIAQQIPTNIRELEGALIRVTAYCHLFNKPLSLVVARVVLKDMVRETNPRVTLEGIQRKVAEHFEVSLEELRGARRQRSILYPRQVAMFLCRRLTEASLPEIGRAFGGRDHTTVMHAVGKIEHAIAQDPHKKQAIEDLNHLVLVSSQRRG